MEFMGTSEAAKKWGVPQWKVSKACRNQRIEKAEQDAPGKPWGIPVEFPNPFTEKKNKVR